MFSLAFFRTSSGNEPVREWLRSLSAEDRAVIGADLRTVQFGFPLGMPLCRSLGQGLHELRSSLPSKREARLIFLHDAEQLIVVGGFIKKSKAAPDRELESARKRQREYEMNKRALPKQA